MMKEDDARSLAERVQDLEIEVEILKGAVSTLAQLIKEPEKRSSRDAATKFNMMEGE